jgi:mRNA-degrading endonuclease RelE of RelBE toxin-antitoxin system
MSENAPWRVTITARAQKDFQRLSLEMQGRIHAAINSLRQGPDHGDTRKLRGAEDGWRLRVGDWRVRFYR